MNSIVTIVSGRDYEELSKLTHSSINAYAEKIGAEFIVIREESLTPHWLKFRLFDLLNKYDRIIYLDSDLIVRDDTPNLFDVVPEDSFGAFDEALYADREHSILKAQQDYKEKVNWNKQYFNSGVLVMSKRHKYVWVEPENKEFNFGEQGYLNLKLQLLLSRKEIKVHSLDYRFNRMTCMEQYLGEERHVAYIIHYAGCPDHAQRMSAIKRDLETWLNKTWTDKKHILISVQGGLGDQICAEPVIRYMIEKTYKGDDIRIETHFPELFKHFTVPVNYHHESVFDRSLPYVKLVSMPGTDMPLWNFLTSNMSHLVDFISIALLKRILPDADKQIKLPVSEKALASLPKLIEKPEEYTLVHPGQSWPSKTFPVQWWEEIIKGLIAKGQKVAIIGKHFQDTIGILDIKVPEALDLRDILDLEGLIAVISKAKCLISNDSAPIHIAGAFDNEIVLITTAKYPDHVLPYRNGSKVYKAKAIVNKLILDCTDTRPLNPMTVTADKVPGTILDFLPLPSEIINSLL